MSVLSPTPNLPRAQEIVIDYCPTGDFPIATVAPGALDVFATPEAAGYDGVWIQAYARVGGVLVPRATGQIHEIVRSHLLHSRAESCLAWEIWGHSDVPSFNGRCTFQAVTWPDGPCDNSSRSYPNASDITPDDVAYQYYDAIYVGVGGDVRITPKGLTDGVTIANVPTGSILPIEVVRVYAAGTTATTLVGLYY